MHPIKLILIIDPSIHTVSYLSWQISTPELTDLHPLDILESLDPSIHTVSYVKAAVKLPQTSGARKAHS